MQRKWPCCLVPKLHHVNDSPFIHTHTVLCQCKCLVPFHTANKYLSVFYFGKRFCCSSSVALLNLKLLFSVFQTPKDPSSREILRCHGHQADPPNPAADLHIYNAGQCLRLAQTNTHMCTRKHIHSLLILHIQNLKICSASSETLSRCVLNPLSVSDYVTLSELYQV